MLLLLLLVVVAVVMMRSSSLLPSSPTPCTTTEKTRLQLLQFLPHCLIISLKPRFPLLPGRFRHEHLDLTRTDFDLFCSVPVFNGVVGVVEDSIAWVDVHKHDYLALAFEGGLFG
jgi:hypothetical protein